MPDSQGASFFLDKLVRDGIAADMLARGQNPQVTPLVGMDLLNALIKKIQEEASQLDPLSDDLMKGLADMSEAIREVAMQKGWPVDEVERQRVARHEKWGGFAGGQYVGRLDLPSGDPWIDYYRQHPERYHEIKSKWPPLQGA